MFCGQDDSTGIPVGRKVQIVSATYQSACFIVALDTPGVALDNYCWSEKLVPSVIHQFNITEKFEDSLFSGGSSGNGYINVTINKATL